MVLLYIYGVWKPNPVTSPEIHAIIKGLKRLSGQFLWALKHGDCELREFSAWVLGRIVEKRAVKPLINIIRKRDGCALNRAIFALAWIGDPFAIPATVELLKEKDVAVRRDAASALGAYDSRRVIKPLATALKDKDELVRNRAANSLGQLGFKQTVALLSNTLMNDRKASVRSEAARALGRIGGPKAEKTLNSAKKDKKSLVKYQVMKAIKRLEVA